MAFTLPLSDPRVQKALEKERQIRAKLNPRELVNGVVVVETPCNTPQPRATSSEPHYRSKTEARYVDELERQRAAGEIKAWRYESTKFRLTKWANRWYMPDFVVTQTDGTVWQVEVKGAWIREKGRLKFEWAREQYPEYNWRMVQWKDGEWRQI